MGWRQYARSVEAAHRRQERDAMRRYRELVKQQRIAEKAAAKRQAADEVAQYETYVELLVSLHKECGQEWNWRAVAKSVPPREPIRGDHNEAAARVALESYRPGFFARLFGGAKRRREELAADVVTASADDSRDHAAAVAMYDRELKAWETERHIAAGVLAGKLDSFGLALSYVAPFAELDDLKARIAVEEMQADALVLSCLLEDEEVIPKEERKLTAAGKMSEKEMPAGRYWLLHQDFVCSCALRLARETMAVLPVARVVVNIKVPRVDKSTGHKGNVAILAAHMTRKAVGALNVEAIDPSDSMKNFQVRMKFKKTSGFEAVDEMTLDEQWVSA